MIAYGMVTRQGFEEALAAASSLDSSESLVGLAAPLDATWLGRISETWDAIENALRQAYEWGRDAGSEAVTKAVAGAEALVRSAGHRARDVHQALLERAQRYLAVLVRNALDQVQAAIVVGGTQLALSSVEVAQRISVHGSLKAAVTELVAITADGEITVSASYRQG